MRLMFYDNNDKRFAIVNGFGTIEREINVYDALSADLPPTAENIGILKKAVRVGVPYPGTNKYQLFKIEKVNLNSKPISLTAIDSAGDDLDTQALIRDVRFVNQPLSKVLPAVFQDTDWNFKQFAPDTSDVISFYRISPKEALKKVEDVFEVEVRFLYTVKGNAITDKTCEIHKQIGQATNVRLVQGQNVTKVDYTQDQTKLYTAAMGRGAGLAITDDSGQETGGYSRSIEFGDVVWSKANGNPVDKPAGQDYVEIPEATQKYGFIGKDGKRKPRFVKFDFQDEQDASKLLQETYDKLLPLSKPQILVESTVARIGNRVNLGDDVSVVIYEPYKLTYKARVIKIEDNPDDSNLTKVSVGFSTVERQAERELNQQQQNEQTNTNLNQQLEEQHEETKRKLTEVDKNASQQVQKAQEAIRKVEESVGKDIDDVKSKLKSITEQNSQGSPIEFYDQNGNIVSGIPAVAYIKSRDGNFILNSNGFNFGGRVLGGNGALYADGIYGETITGYDIKGAHITGGTIQGVTIEGQSYFRSEGAGGVAVVSGDYGFSFGNTHIGSSNINFANTLSITDSGIWTQGDMRASGKVIANNGLSIGGSILTQSDIDKLHRLKG